MRKKLLSILTLLLTTMSVWAQTSGSCGDGVTWSLSGGTLTISKTGEGTGAMEDFAPISNPPEWPSTITSIVIESGVTSIGDLAFYGFGNLTSVTIPASVTKIGESVFSYCGSLSTVTIAEGSQLTSIGAYAFQDCKVLTSITIPNGVTSIGVDAFQGCEGLTSLTIPSSVTSIDDDAFYYCKNVTEVYCYADPAILVWNDGGIDDFKDSKATVCHVLDAEAFKANWSKGVDTDVNVTFDTAMKGNSDGAGNYWATYYNATNSFKADANTTVYQAALNGDKSKVLLTEVPNREIPATKPVILKSSAEVITLTPASTTEELNGNGLSGQAHAGAAPANAYCLSMNASGEVGFYKFSGNGVNEIIPAYRAYLIIDSGAGARTFYGFGGNETTAIENLTPAVVEEDGDIYDLSGRRVNGQPTRKGIYVKNGKKVVIK